MVIIMTKNPSGKGLFSGKMFGKKNGYLQDKDRN